MVNGTHVTWYNTMIKLLLILLRTCMLMYNNKSVLHPPGASKGRGCHYNTTTLVHTKSSKVYIHVLSLVAALFMDDPIPPWCGLFRPEDGL